MASKQGVRGFGGRHLATPGAASSDERSSRRVIQVHSVSRTRDTDFKTSHRRLRSRALGVAAAGLPLAAAFAVGAPTSTVHAAASTIASPTYRSEEHTSELQSLRHLV